ncbi:hypothetical protein EVAR_21437_1 [Eumeta japonica]|uniref:Uncharacterized protein n=1 Tax=Eumeta variegata TaxID=151549 RepID=A0A4C1VHR8_EUMVA|nr:hypothetical protein EVAR_21437_1 [Eumeta japonica]
MWRSPIRTTLATARNPKHDTLLGPELYEWNNIIYIVKRKRARSIIVGRPRTPRTFRRCNSSPRSINVVYSVGGFDSPQRNGVTSRLYKNRVMNEVFQSPRSLDWELTPHESRRPSAHSTLTMLKHLTSGRPAIEQESEMLSDLSSHAIP